MKRMRKKRIFDYCGKRYGAPYYLTGFMIGAFLAFNALEILIENSILSGIGALILGLIFSKKFVDFLIVKRRKQFAEEFCDYLDSIGSSLSCGKNTYEAFLTADKEMHDLYRKDLPIYIESSRLADGLLSGRQIDELLKEMAERSGNDDVKTFADVYSICNDVGGDLKKIVNDTKTVIIEKSEIEAEINTVLAEPHNELRIMSIMPIFITLALRSLGDQFLGQSGTYVNIFAVIIFVFAYFIGLRIVDIKV